MNKNTGLPTQLPQARQELATIKEYIPGKGSGDAIKLSSNENPLGTSPLAVSVLHHHSTLLHRYPDGFATELRAMLAEKNNISADMVHIGNGSDEIIQNITLAYLASGEKVLIPHHTFSEYRRASQIAGAHISTIPMKEGTIDPEQLRMLLKTPAKIVFLCHPNNPTGSTLPKLESLLQIISPKTLVVIDQAYAEFADDSFEDAKNYISRFPNLVVLHTFSKLYGLASLRIGVAYAQSHIIARINQVKLPFNIGILSQLAACAALVDDLFIEDTLKLVKTGKIRLQELCENLAIPYFKSNANFLCMHIGDDAERFYLFCAERKLYVRHLASFDMPEHIRVSIGSKDEMDVFFELLRAWKQEQKEQNASPEA